MPCKGSLTLTPVLKVSCTRSLTWVNEHHKRVYWLLLVCAIMNESSLAFVDFPQTTLIVVVKLQQCIYSMGDHLKVPYKWPLEWQVTLLWRVTYWERNWLGTEVSVPAQTLWYLSQSLENIECMSTMKEFWVWEWTSMNEGRTHFPIYSCCGVP